MKLSKRRCVVLVLTFSLIINVLVLNISAIGTEFSTEELSEADCKTFINNINATLMSEAPDKGGIVCFDVNDNGKIAVGQKGVSRKEVCIYSSNGTFLYGYSFNCTGSFAVEWNSDNLNIYFVRSGVIISVDPSGEVLEVKSVPDTANNNRYLRELLYSRVRIVGESKYIVRNDMGLLNLLATSYSQVLIVDSDGIERIIYDVNVVQLTQTVVLLVIATILFLVAAILITREFIKAKRGKAV